MTGFPSKFLHKEYKRLIYSDLQFQEKYQIGKRSKI